MCQKVQVGWLWHYLAHFEVRMAGVCDTLEVPYPKQKETLPYFSFVFGDTQTCIGTLKMLKNTHSRNRPNFGILCIHRGFDTTSRQNVFRQFYLHVLWRNLAIRDSLVPSAEEPHLQIEKRNDDINFITHGRCWLYDKGRLPRIYPKTGLAFPLEMRVILCRQRRMTTRRDALRGIVVSLNWHYNQLQPVSAIRNPNIFLESSCL